MGKSYKNEFNNNQQKLWKFLVLIEKIIPFDF